MMRTKKNYPKMINKYATEVFQSLIESETKRKKNNLFAPSSHQIVNIIRKLLN